MMTLQATINPVQYPNIAEILADQIMKHAAHNDARVVYTLCFVVRELGIDDAEIEAHFPGPWSLAELRTATNKANANRDRAKKHRLKEHFSTFEWLDLLASTGGRCEICGGADRPLTVEHKTAMVDGGSNAIENIAATCEGCNQARDMASDDYLMRVTGWQGWA